jgi:hypothetical protein
MIVCVNETSVFTRWGCDFAVVVCGSHFISSTCCCVIVLVRFQGGWVQTVQTTQNWVAPRARVLLLLARNLFFAIPSLRSLFSKFHGCSVLRFLQKLLIRASFSSSLCYRDTLGAVCTVNLNGRLLNVRTVGNLPKSD